MRSERPGSGQNTEHQPMRRGGLARRRQSSTRSPYAATSEALARPVPAASAELPGDEPPYWSLLYGGVAAAEPESAQASQPPQPHPASAGRRLPRRRRLVLACAAGLALLATTLLARPLLARWAAPRDPIAHATPGAIDVRIQDAFDAAWERADLLVQLGDARRSWVWGPAPFISGKERYAGAPDGMRSVQYYDKGRLELNDPQQPGSVSSGLLVREMVTGEVAIGDGSANVERRRPATIAIAGDAVPSNPAPTYADLSELAVPDGQAASSRVGSAVDELLEGGAIGSLPPDAQALAAQATIATFDERTKHNIPQVFRSFLEQHAAVYEAGRVRRGQPLFAPWETIVGLPLTEPYWIAAQIGGQRRWVLAQLFERRVLTFTPDNAPPYQVEMGNVGRHYWEWRYGRPVDAPPALQTAEAPGELVAHRAAVNWSSDRPLVVEIVYRGAGDATTKRIAGGLASNGAAVVLDQLQAGTRYVWRAVGTDADGNVVRSAPRSFRTPGAPPPGAVGKSVCLTFDDGPAPGTEAVLDALAGVPATFFLVGNSMGSAPDRQRAIVERMLREGHQIANHTLTHMPMAESAYRATYGTLADEASIARFRENLVANEAHFQRVLNTTAQLFYHARLPGDGGVVKHNGTAIYADAVRAMGMTYVHWNVEFAPSGRMGQLWATDWQGIRGLASNTADLPQPGAVVLLHDAHFAGRADLLRAIVERLSASGYTFGRLDSAGGCTEQE